MRERLDEGGLPIDLGAGITLTTPGLMGEAEVHLPSGTGFRSAEAVTDVFRDALAGAGLDEQLTIEITEAAEIDLGGGGATRSTARGEPAIVAEVPGPGKGFGQVVLHVDESGIATWHIAEEERGGSDALRSSGKRTYVIRRHVPPPAPAGATRGLFGAIGRKLIKVLTFKAIEIVGGAAGQFFVRRWELAQRKYGVRAFDPSDYRSETAHPLDGDWARFHGRHALLFVHGTFSRAHSAFGGLPAETFGALHARYGKRVFAFDHPTASEDPDQNVRELIHRLPDDARMTFDIVCHSRGGLVSRALAQRLDRLSLGGRKLRVGKIVFVATPNAGTKLTDEEHMGTYLDVLTSAVSLFPDNGITDALEIILEVVKQVAVGTLAGLDGLQSMRPGGKWLTALNAEPELGATYYAVGADYEPTGGLLDFAKDAVMDRVFEGEDNDLVVPTAGVRRVPGSSAFRVEESIEIPSSAGAWHSSLFEQEAVSTRLLRWLDGSPPPA